MVAGHLPASGRWNLNPHSVQTDRSKRVRAVLRVGDLVFSSGFAKLVPRDPQRHCAAGKPNFDHMTRHEGRISEWKLEFLLEQVHVGPEMTSKKYSGAFHFLDFGRTQAGLESESQKT